MSQIKKDRNGDNDYSEITHNVYNLCVECYTNENIQKHANKHDSNHDKFILNPLDEELNKRIYRK
jgi:hypothetical protein